MNSYVFDMLSDIISNQDDCYSWQKKSPLQVTAKWTEWNSTFHPTIFLIKEVTEFMAYVRKRFEKSGMII